MLRFPAFENQTLKRSEWALASDLALATWLRVATQAALAENGGRFVGAATWDDRAWTVMAGVSKAGVEAAVEAEICAWADDALVVVGYETKAETIVQQRREHGRLSPGRPPEKGGKNQPGNRAGNQTGNRSGRRTVNHKDNHTGNHAIKALSSPLPSDPSPSDPLPSKSGRADQSGRAERPPAAVLEDPEPDPLEVVTSAFRARFQAEPRWERGEIGKYLPQLADLDREVLGEVARRFFDAEGRRPGDTYWKDRGWSLHLLVTQALEGFLTVALDAVNARREAANRERSEQQRRAAEKAAADDEARRDEEEIAALPPSLRAWRLARRDVGPFLDGLLSDAAIEVADDGRLVVRPAAQTSRFMPADAREKLAAAFARRADGLGIALDLVAA